MAMSTMTDWYWQAPTPKSEGGAWLLFLTKSLRRGVYTIHSWAWEQLHSLPEYPDISQQEESNSSSLRSSYFHEEIWIKNKSIAINIKHMIYVSNGISKHLSLFFPKTKQNNIVSKNDPSAVSRRRWILSKGCLDSSSSWRNPSDGLRNLKTS